MKTLTQTIEYAAITLLDHTLFVGFVTLERLYYSKNKLKQNSH